MPPARTAGPEEATAARRNPRPARRLVAPAVPGNWIVIAKSGTDAKSTASSVPLGLTATCTVVATVRAPASSIAVTDTGTAPALSGTCVGSTVRAMDPDVVSLSTSDTVAAVTGRSAVPSTTSASFGSSSASSTGVSVNVSVPLAFPAAIVMTKSGTGAKSAVSSASFPATATVTAVASVRVAPLSDAVTVTAVTAVAPSPFDTWSDPPSGRWRPKRCRCPPATRWFPSPAGRRSPRSAASPPPRPACRPPASA